MRPYETLVVLSNELGDGKQQLLDRLQAVIQDGGGVLDANQDWGTRRLAYVIKRQSEGHYYLLEYQAEPAVVREVERTLRITDGVLRYLSVQQEHTGLPTARPAPTRDHEDVPLSAIRERRGDDTRSRHDDREERTPQGSTTEATATGGDVPTSRPGAAGETPASPAVPADETVGAPDAVAVSEDVEKEQGESS